MNIRYLLHATSTAVWGPGILLNTTAMPRNVKECHMRWNQRTGATLRAKQFNYIYRRNRLNYE